MRQNLVIFLTTSVLVLLTGALFFIVENPLAKNDGNNRAFFQTAQRLELLIENELLKRKTLLQVSFDGIEVVKREVQYLCSELKNPDRHIEDLSGKMHGEIQNYCRVLNQKIENLNKSSVLQVRLRDLLTQMQGNVRAGADDLVRAVFYDQVFASISSREYFFEKLKNRRLLKKKITGKIIAVSDVDTLAQNIFNVSEEINQVSNEIFNPFGDQILNRILFQYNEIYWQKQNHSLHLRQALGTFGFLMLLISIVYGIRLGTGLSKSARQRIESIGEIAGYLAHEINNPLTTALYKVNKLQKQLDAQPDISGKDLARDVSVLQEATEQIRRISKGIRDLSLDPEPHVERIDVENLIDKALDLFLAKFQKYGVRFEYVNDAKSVLFVDCRQKEISQALLTLLNNAFEAVRPVSDKWIKIQLSEGGRAQEISLKVSHSGNKVSDTLNFSKEMIISNKGEFSLNKLESETEFKILLPRAPADKLII